jgi:soluble lytic murein transglycosylase-like protein
MALVQSARWRLVTVAFALSLPTIVNSAAARDFTRTQRANVTPSLADQPSPPPEIVFDAVLNAGRSTGIDPALLLTIAWTESGFRTEAKNQTSSAAGLLQFTEQTWCVRQGQNMDASERSAHCYIVGSRAVRLPKRTRE